MAASLYRYYLPAMPLAVEQWDFSGYDLVISSSSAVVKGLITGPGQTHISYVHSPMRYAWDLQDAYLRQARFGGLKGLAARVLLNRIRIWDQVASQRVDHFVANSSFVAQRIEKFYRRESQIVAPPVDTERFSPTGQTDDFFLIVSRLVPYKRVDLVVEAFSKMPDRKLVVIGDGPERRRALRHATPNVTWLGRQPDSVVEDHMKRCRAYISAAVEDFGISMMEAHACGKPVISLNRGGARETLSGLDARVPTAVFFEQQSAESIAHAIDEFDRFGHHIDPQACRDSALRFAPDKFRRFFLEAVRVATGTRPTEAQAAVQVR